MDFARTVRTMRVARGWSQADLAEISGLSGPAISMLETGRREPRADTAKRIAQALGVSMTELLGGAAPEIPAEMRALLAELDAANLARAIDYVDYLLRRQRSAQVIATMHPHDGPPKPPRGGARRRRPQESAATEAAGGEAPGHQGNSLDIMSPRRRGPRYAPRYVGFPLTAGTASSKMTGREAA